MKSVVDNVAVQVVENCLLSGINELISPVFIMQMDKELVCRTAGELQQSQGLRLKTQQKLKILQAGLGVCAVYMKRKCEIALLTRGTSGLLLSCPNFQTLPSRFLIG